MAGWLIYEIFGMMPSAGHGRLRMRPIQFLLAEARHKNLRPFDLVPLDLESRSSILWYLQPGRLEEGVSLTPLIPTLWMETDASLTGWGCKIGNCLSSGIWSEKESSLHINLLELKAIFQSLFLNHQLLRNQTVAMLGDNTTALAYISHEGGTRSWGCFLEAKKILLLAESLNISLIPRFIQGAQNVVADSLSRSQEAPATEWVRNLEIYQVLWSLWGVPSVDVFATSFNTRLRNYFSPIPDPKAVGIDAFLQDWSHQFLYMFPPFKLLN